MIVIYHEDRHGNPWRFKMDCTRGQAAIFARFLRVLRNTRPRERFRNKETETHADNARFCSDLENLILSALYERYPATENDYYKNEFFAL